VFFHFFLFLFSFGSLNKISFYSSFLSDLLSGLIHGSSFVIVTFLYSYLFFPLFSLDFMDIIR